MIYYGEDNIYDWNYGTSNLIKVYKNGAICYYKIVSGSTPSQEPCFAVVDDIEEYSSTEFVDVYDKATEKWYKLNNLNEFEEYGIYATTTSTTYYQGKLAIVSESSSSSESSSRLPNGYTEVEYIENTGQSSVNLGVQANVVGNSYEIVFDNEMTWESGGGNLQTFLACQNEQNYHGWSYRFTNNGTYEFSCASVVAATCNRTNVSGSTYHNVISCSNVGRSCNCTWPVVLFSGLDSSQTPFRFVKGKLYTMQITLNNQLVRNLVPAKRDSDNVYGAYDLVNDVFYTSTTSDALSGGTAVTPTPTPTPTTKVEYQYSGSSWVNLGEVSGSSITIQSPEYLEKDSSHQGAIPIDKKFTPNTKIQIKIYPTYAGGQVFIGDDCSSDTNDLRMFWAGSSLYFDIASKRISRGGKYLNQLYELEFGNYYIKNLSTGVNLVTGTPQTFERSCTLNTFSDMTNGCVPRYNTSDNNRIYYIKIYESDVLVRDFIPCISGNTYGWFDKESLAFYPQVGSLGASSTINEVEVGGGEEYPVYYSEKQEPPTSVEFEDMAEALAYECPYVGLLATIDGDPYYFNSNYRWQEILYQWVTVSGEYVCNDGDKYTLEKEQVSYDGGTTWADTSNTRQGTLIESGSPDCAVQCSYNFCGEDANGNAITVDNGTTTLNRSNLTSNLAVVNGIVGNATTTIGSYCFQDIKTTLTSLTLMNSVTTIEHEAFMETSGLTTLTIPSSITQIDYWAFTRCRGLTEVIFEGTTPPTFTNQYNGVFHDYCPTVIYVPDSAVSTYRAIGGSVWTNKTWSDTIIQPISNRTQ